MMFEIKQVQLKELLSEPTRNGLTKPKAIRGQGVPMIAMGEVFANNRIYSIQMERVPVTDKELLTSSIYDNDLLFARQSLVLEGAGKCCIVKEVNEPTVFESHLIRVRVDKTKALPDYIYYYFNSYQGRENIKTIVEQVAAAGIRGSDLVNLYIPIPLVTVQQQIVQVLMNIDDKIAVNTAINENLHQLIAAYYAEIFKECEHTAKISDYADRVFSGGTPTTSNESYWSGEFKWLSSGETSQKYIVDTEKTITQAGVDNSSTRFAKKYATVIASAGQGHTRGQTSMLLTDTYINQSIIVVESERIFMPFIYWNICGRYEELRVISNSNSIRGSLTTKMISAFTAPKADITLISRFSELAWAAIHEIEKNCNEIVRLSALRDTLLPKLMNGEIDVSEVKI